MEKPDWIQRSRRVDDVIIDIGFLVQKSVYYGDENNFTHDDWLKLREPVYQPKTDMYGDFLLSESVLESRIELIRYYQDVIRALKVHRLKIEKLQTYSWLRPIIFSRGVFAMTFPWYDTWQEAESLFNGLQNVNDGLIFEDMDQGWEFNAFAEHDTLFLRQGDLETGKEHFLVRCPRDLLTRQIQKIRERMPSILHELRTTIGHDYWSKM